jgi:GTP-binding protein LepA
MPPPRGARDAPLQALVIDSWFDPNRGVICLVRVKQGRLRRKELVRFAAVPGKSFEVLEIGAFTPHSTGLPELVSGEVGFFAANIKEVRDAKVGDTILHASDKTSDVLPGFREAKPMVYAGFFPIQASGYEALRDALEKLRLNDSAFTFEPETSLALGFGFRCGFLGLLHMQIVQERLEREFNAELITTSPTAVYRVTLADGTVKMIDNPSMLPKADAIEKFEEPMVQLKVHTPSEHVGALLKLCEDRRGIQKNMDFVTPTRVMITYEMPLAEIVYDFFDRMKSLSRGYASMDYEQAGYREAPLIKLDVLLNGEPVDALSIIVHRDRAYDRGKILCEKLRAIIPRQQFDVAIQAAIGSRVISRETVKAFRKDVTAKCYGGDISRKRKLLERQKEGKKRMKQVGSVELPQEAFLSVLKVDDE